MISFSLFMLIVTLLSFFILAYFLLVLIDDIVMLWSLILDLRRDYTIWISKVIEYVINTCGKSVVVPE